MAPFIPEEPRAAEETARRIDALAKDERFILESLLARLEFGQRQFGPWVVGDGRDYPEEAFQEVLDGLHYCAAELVRQKQVRAARRRRIYVCHPFADDPAQNVARVRGIAQRLVSEGAWPVAPHLYLPQLVDDASERALSLSLCLELVATTDELRVYGRRVTEGMASELEAAQRCRIPVTFEGKAPR